MLIFDIFKNSSSTFKHQNRSQYACKFKCYISKSKLVLSECNDPYFIAIAFIAFTLHEIKQCPNLLGTPSSPPWIPEPSRRFNLLFTVEGSGIQSTSSRNVFDLLTEIRNKKVKSSLSYCLINKST
jgi:hypothetical protein